MFIQPLHVLARQLSHQITVVTDLQFNRMATPFDTAVPCDKTDPWDVLLHVSLRTGHAVRVAMN